MQVRYNNFAIFDQ